LFSPQLLFLFSFFFLICDYFQLRRWKMNISWFTTFSALVLTSHCYLSLVSSEAINPDPEPTNSVETVTTRGNGNKPCAIPAEWKDHHPYCAEDGLSHGCTPGSGGGGLCWKQCEYGEDSWCWTGKWIYSIFISSNTCQKSSVHMGEQCYNHKTKFCRTFCTRRVKRNEQ